MKKWFFIAIAILTSAAVYADPPEKVETLSSKVTLKSKDGYFVFSDGSCWKAVGFSKRWRTPSEWWNNVQLVPENYECVPNDWYLGAQIEAYPKYGNLEVDESDASNQEVLKQCTHLLVNSRTGQVLFAIALSPAECIVQLFEEAHEQGYNDGFAQGRRTKGTDMYNRGQEEGYKKGYTEGYRSGLRGEPQREGFPD